MHRPNRSPEALNLEELIAGLREGTLSEAESVVLSKRIETDAAARRRLNEYMFMDSAFQDASFFNEIDVSSGVAAVAQVPQVVSFRTGRRRRFLGSAFAAALLATIYLGLLVIPRGDEESESAIIARLGYAETAVWVDGSAMLMAGDVIGTDLLALESGIARLDFPDGTKVTLQGPAKLEVLAPGRLFLHAGTLAAKMGQSSDGLVVATATAEIQDLGTAFGMIVGAKGETDVHVFDGEVAVSLPGAAPLENFHLTEGLAVRITSIDEGVVSAPFDGIHFGLAWQVISGVTATTGLVGFEIPGPMGDMSQYSSNQRGIIFQEREAVYLDAPLTVNLIESGFHQLSGGAQTKTLPAGISVTSYLVHFLLESLSEAAGSRRIKGVIVFERPITAVFTHSDQLDATDALFGNASTEFLLDATDVLLKDASTEFLTGKWRGLEWNSLPPVTNEDRRDEIEIGSDRKTLRFDLELWRATDQFRVLVEAE